MRILDLFSKCKDEKVVASTKTAKPKISTDYSEKEKIENDVRRIRLIYVEIEKFTQYGTGDKKFGETLQVSCPYILPKGMTIKDACKVISYLSEKVERKYNLEPASQRSVDKLVIFWGNMDLFGNMIFHMVFRILLRMMSLLRGIENLLNK